jgi:hypothetical protein
MMIQSECKKSYSFDRPGNYRIRFEGYLNKKWSGRLGGMSLTTTKTGDHKPVSVLEGPIRDQAELVGVLNALYQRHLTLLAVEQIDYNK